MKFLYPSLFFPFCSFYNSSSSDPNKSLCNERSIARFSDITIRQTYGHLDLPGSCPLISSFDDSKSTTLRTGQNCLCRPFFLCAFWKPSNDAFFCRAMPTPPRLHSPPTPDIAVTPASSSIPSFSAFPSIPGRPNPQFRGLGMPSECFFNSTLSCPCR